MVTICLHTGHFEITKSEQVAKKKLCKLTPNSVAQSLISDSSLLLQLY